MQHQSPIQSRRQ